MYHEFYKLAVLPFENTPDPRFFYASEQHREALAAIEYTIRMRKGFVLVTGDIGSGKTTVGHAMIERCGNQATIVHLTHGHQNGDELLRQVLRFLELPYRRTDDHARRLERFKAMLVEKAFQNRPVVLLVDEAQTLSDEALEELRLLTNYDTAEEKLLQIVLIGQPELRTRLRSSRLCPLRQRIVMAKQLRPLNLEKTASYIAHRLRIASRDPKNVAITFDEGSINEIYRFTGGIPRLINVACDNCLLLGFVRQSRQITSALVKQALEDMMPNLEDSPKPVTTMRVVAKPAKSLAGSLS